MPPQSRYTDLGVGVCICHITSIPMTGMVLTSSSNHIVENLGAARRFDLVLGFCGHIGILITASATKLINNNGACRIGDMFSGCFTGTLITGAGTYITGG
jgi:hypothetical protein